MRDIPYVFNPFSSNFPEGGVLFSKTSEDYVSHFWLESCYKGKDVQFVIFEGQDCVTKMDLEGVLDRGFSY